MDTSERIRALRALMEERNIDVYYVPNQDDHMSEEYTADCYKCKSWLSGFSGDAGCTIVTRDFAGLWTDGRYFTQAEDELAGSEVQLMRLRQAGVPDPMQFLTDHTPENGLLGFDGSVVSAADSLKLSARLQKKHASLHISEDLVGMIWKDRPQMPAEQIFVLDEKFTGSPASERIASVRAAMAEKGADLLVLTSLEDPCWLLNVRGNDIPCTPVPYAFAMVSAEDVRFYADPMQIGAETADYLKRNGVTVRPYGEIYADLASVSGRTVWADLTALNTRLYDALGKGNNRILNEVSPVVMKRAVKNETEIRNTRAAHIRDGVAMVRFIRWVKENAGSGEMTEVSAADRLYALRAEGENYLEPSFETIAAYQENAAMMHYTATPEKHAVVKPRGFLLVDSGGTYLDGTTDITRTISLGALTEEERKYYTLVLKGHLDLAHARFLYGTTGNNLDILARKPLWDLHIDYQCGTGHGVGHVLGVHEGPHGVRWGMQASRGGLVPLEAGMIVTDEPGIYLPHELGIRIENELLVAAEEENFYGRWMHFEDLTYCPYDLDAIDVKWLSRENIEQINAYHRRVRETLLPYLSEEDGAWLKEATGEIGL